MATVRANQRPIVVRRVKKAAPGHQGGAWKVAYADFVTAMMAFFMLLWLISNPDAEQLKGLAEYFSAAPPSSSTSTTMTSLPGELPGLGGRTRRAQGDDAAALGQMTREAGTQGAARGGTAQVPDASMRVLAAELRVMMDSTAIGDAAAMRVDDDRRGLRINLIDTSDRAMFRAGTAELNPFAREVLAKLAAPLAKSGARLAIEGHTDGLGGQGEANWRLSGERALAARRALVAGGVTDDGFAEVVARGFSEPIYPDQPERPENRRIVVFAIGEAPALPTTVGFGF